MATLFLLLDVALRLLLWRPLQDHELIIVSLFMFFFLLVVIILYVFTSQPSSSLLSLDRSFSFLNLSEILDALWPTALIIHHLPFSVGLLVASFITVLPANQLHKDLRTVSWELTSINLASVSASEFASGIIWTFKELMRPWERWETE